MPLRRSGCRCGTEHVFDTGRVRELEVLGRRVSPSSLAGEHLLPLHPAAGPLTPRGGLQRGSVVAVHGPGPPRWRWVWWPVPSAAGSWVVGVGHARSSGSSPRPSWASTSSGWCWWTRRPGRQWATVVAALAEAFDVVLVRPTTRCGRATPAGSSPGSGSGAGCSCSSPAGAGAWPDAPDLTFTAVRPRVARAWRPRPRAPAGSASRLVQVAVDGRRAAARGRSATLWLPGPDGELAPRPALTRPFRDLGTPMLVQRVGEPAARSCWSRSDEPSGQQRDPGGVVPRLAGGGGRGGRSTSRPWWCTPTGWWPARRRPGPRGWSAGLRRREAQGRCPEAVLLADDPARDARAFEPVVGGLEALTPRVEVTRPGTCAFATRGPSRYYGGDDALADRVGRGARRRAPGPPRRSGSASPTGCSPPPRGPAAAPGAAAWSSRRAAAPPSSPPGRSRPLVEATIAEVAGLPRPHRRARRRAPPARAAHPRRGWPPCRPADVLARFGTDGRAAHRLARGLDARPLAARRPAPDLAVTAELDPPVERVDTAAFVAVGPGRRAARSAWAAGAWPAPASAIEAETEHGEAARAAAGATRAASARRPWPSGCAGSSTAGSSGSAATGPPPASPACSSTPTRWCAARGRQLGFWGGETRLDERAARALARVAGPARPRGRPGARAAGRAGPGRAGGAGAGARRSTWSTGRPARARPGWVTEPWPGRLPGRRRRRWSTPTRRRSTLARRGRAGRSGSAAGAASRAAPVRGGRRRPAARWRPGPGRGRPTSAGGTRPPTAAGPASRWSRGRHRPPPRPRGRPLAPRGHLRLMHGEGPAGPSPSHVIAARGRRCRTPRWCPRRPESGAADMKTTTRPSSETSGVAEWPRLCPPSERTDTRRTSEPSRRATK